MDNKVDTAPSAFDTAKLLLALVVLVGSIVAYYWYGNVATVIRAAGIVVAFVVGGWIAMQSFHGRQLWRFVQASRVELRKVVWPTREETIQTTIAVIVFAAIMGVFFWLFDLLLLATVNWLMGG